MIKLVRVLAKLFPALYQLFFLCLHLYANRYEYIKQCKQHMEVERVTYFRNEHLA